MSPLSRALLIVLTLAFTVAACGHDVVDYAGHDFSSDPAPTGPLNGLIVTTDFGSDTLSVVDPSSGDAVWTIPVGFIPVELEGPHHIAADPAGHFLYVNLAESVPGSGTGPHGAHGTGTQPGYTLKLDSANGRLVSQTRVDPNPGDLTLSADGSSLYVTHYDLIKWTQGAAAGNLRLGDANLVVINTSSMTIRATLPLCPAPHGVRISADGNTLYSTCGPDEIAVVDLTDLSKPAVRALLPGRIESGSCARCPYAIGIAPDASVWVSSLGPESGGEGQGGIDVYDPALGAFDPARSVTMCGRAVFAAFAGDPGAYTAYVPEQGCGDFIDEFAPSGHPGPRILLPPGECVNAHMIRLSDDNLTANLVCEGDHVNPGSLAAVDLTAQTVRWSTPLGVFPDGLVLVPARAP